MVGTDLGSVKEQLCDLKVSSYAFTTNDESVLDKYVCLVKKLMVRYVVSRYFRVSIPDFQSKGAAWHLLGKT